MIETSVTGRLAIVRLSGQFDLANAPELRSIFNDLADGGVTDFTVDLSSVEFFDVTALNALVAAYNDMKRVDGRMVLVGVNPLTARLLQVAHLDHVLLPFTLPLADSPRDSETNASDRDLSEDFYALAQMLLGEPSLSGELDHIVRAAVATISGCDAASIALIVLGVSRTAAASSYVAIEVDVAQYTLNEGPCLTAAQVGQRIRVDMVDADEDYRHFASRAIEHGIHATLTVPLVLGGDTVGTLNLYSTSPGAFDRAAEEVADVLATQAAIAIQHSILYGEARRLSNSVQQYADELAEVTVAEGALSVLYQCSAEQAGHLLRRTADTNRERIVEAARRIIRQLAGQASEPDST